MNHRLLCILLSILLAGTVAAQTNVALNRPATQSSTYAAGGAASRGVDGNVDGTWGGASITHTNQEVQPYWEVDLGALHSISEVRLWNRTDCCPDRLGNFHLLVSEQPFTSAALDLSKWNRYVGSNAGRPTTIAVNTVGRYVRVQLAGSTPRYLTIAEAEVFGVAASGVETVWVEDQLPAGALAAAENDSWTWTSSSPAPFSGSLAHRSNIAAGMHQHYFQGAAQPLAVQPGDVLFAYVYIDPDNPVGEVMLQWNDGTWEHRAYWGSDEIWWWGTAGSNSRRRIGDLPPAGQWARLEVPASAVGLENSSVHGMAFTLHGGRATWDRAGILRGGAPPPSSTPVSMQILPASTTDLNYRLAGLAGFSTSFVSGDPQHYRLYAASHLPRLKWKDQNSLDDFFYSSVLGLVSDSDRCSSGVERIWVNDATPSGSTELAYADNWTWITANPQPFHGARAHQSDLAAGIHQHYFTNATATPLRVQPGDRLFAYVYLDPLNMPAEVMLQWYDGTWEHRAYWGADNIPWGSPSENPGSRRRVGDLPEGGAWARLEVPAADVGLAGSTVTGMAFTLHGGRATWDYAGKRDAGIDPANWNSRCIDSIGVYHKRVTCAPGTACQNNDRWNAWPGLSNISTFPVRPPLDDSGFGWPLNRSWGLANATSVINMGTINSAQPSPPPTSAFVKGRCHPTNPRYLATAAANAKAVQVRYTDAAGQPKSRWFMAYNSQIHAEHYGGGGSDDIWRVQWAHSDDGFTWTLESRPLIRSHRETLGCAEGYLVTDLLYDGGFFYMVLHELWSDRIFLLRSAFVPGSTTGYDGGQGWFVRGSASQWIQVFPSQLGQQFDLYAMGGRSILPTRFGAYPGAVKQTAIGRVFASSAPNADSRYIALTLDQHAGLARPVVQLWTAPSLNAAFEYQSDVANVPFGGYGYEFGFTHHADNLPATPRLFDDDLEIWFVDSFHSEGSPQYMGTASLTVTRRRARLSGGIYGN